MPGFGRGYPETVFAIGWLWFLGAVIAVGILFALALTAWSPIFAVIVIAVLGVLGGFYLVGRRAAGPSEREFRERAREAEREAGPAGGEGAASSGTPSPGSPSAPASG